MGWGDDGSGLGQDRKGEEGERECVPVQALTPARVSAPVGRVVVKVAGKLQVSNWDAYVHTPGVKT